MPKTPAELLEEVEAAISRALDAQSWKQGGRSESYAELDALFARRRELLAEIDRATRGGARMRQAVPLG